MARPPKGLTSSRPQTWISEQEAAHHYTTAAAVLKIRRPNIHCRDTHFADSKNKCVANSSPVTHQPLRQQGGTGEDSYVHLADWTLSVAAIEKKKKITIFLNYAGPLVVDILPGKATMTRSLHYTGTVLPNFVGTATKCGNHKNNLLFHDNAAPHKARVTIQ